MTSRLGREEPWTSKLGVAGGHPSSSPTGLLTDQTADRADPLEVSTCRSTTDHAHG
jgi:hypothetical protein